MSSFATFLTGRAAEGPAFKGLRLRLPLGKWLSVARERRHLNRLSDHQLRDIGIDGASAIQESARPFWDLPEGR